MADPRDEQPDVPLLRRQDPQAFARLVRDHERIVLGLGQARGLRGANLEDAAADVFSSVWRALPRFEGRSSLGTWVYRIACRTIDKHRSRDTRFQIRTLTSDPPDPVKRPDHRTEEAERDELIWELVASLEPRQSMAVELFYRRGWPIEQIAQTMECPSGTVKTLLFRAGRS